jgi:hypothetical protein
MSTEVACRENFVVEHVEGQQLGPFTQNCPVAADPALGLGPIVPTEGCFEAAYGSCSSVSTDEAAKGPSGFWEAAGKVVVPSLAILGAGLAIRFAPRAFSPGAAEAAIDRAVASNLAEALTQRLTANWRLWHEIHPMFRNYSWTVKRAPEAFFAFSKGSESLLVRVHNGTEFRVPLRQALRLIEKLERIAGIT